MNKEIPEWILVNLCYYDNRNPDNVLDLMEEEDKKLFQIEKCYCSNCFYNRTKLANELVKMYEKKIN